MGRVVVRYEEKESDTKCEEGENEPANHAQVEQEELHLVALHHLHTQTDSILTADFGIILQNEFRHGVRIAFDDVKTERAYVKALKMSVNHGMRKFSNYLLYNFKDKPEDLYHRLRINVDLCEELDVDIYSFPMKYHPINGEHSHDRDYVGENWNRKYIRAVQAILNATKGKIGRGMPFFERAFGRTEEEYMEMLLMPETFIIFRFFFEEIGYTARWRGAMSELSDSEREELYPLIFKNDFNHIEDLTDNKKFRRILAFYKDYRKEIADHKSELFKMKQEYEAKHKTDIQ